MPEEIRPSEELLNAALESNEKFGIALRSTMKKIGISARDLSEGSGIPISTINKIIYEGRDLRLSTLRDIFRFIQSKERSPEGDLVIGIIAARASLDIFAKNKIFIKGKNIVIKEYPANSIEDAIISAIKAERDRVHGIVCAYIVASIIEKFVRVPIMTIKVDEASITDSISLLAEKIISKP
ncbi:MAG: transcriptional regulator [Candidatus Methanomethylicia archaeon]|nr:transcriptional regulator [Candidatus Methanomethylicia archaeon]